MGHRTRESALRATLSRGCHLERLATTVIVIFINSMSLLTAAAKIRQEAMTARVRTFLCGRVLRLSTQIYRPRE